MKWYYLLTFFAIIILIRFIINFYKFKRTNKLYQNYLDYLREPDFKFVQYKEEIKSLFKDAGLTDSSVLHQEFVGFGHFSNTRVSVFDNLTNRREDIVANVRSRFNEAIGVYRKRFKESFNPIFWIDFIVKFPQYIMEFFGVLPEKIAVKVFLIIYWIIAIIFGLKKFNILENLLQ